MKAKATLRLAVLAAALALGSAPIWAQSAANPSQSGSACDRPASELVGSAAMGELLAKGGLSSLDSDGAAKLLPNWAGAEPIKTALAAEKPQVLVEALFFYPRAAPEGAAAQKAELAYIYGLMREFSTLRGIKYYSQTQKAMETLYVEAYRVADLRDLAKLPDPSPPAIGSIPAAERFYVFLQDQRFGKNVYRYEYTSYPDGFLVDTTNETPMNFLLFTIFGQQKLKMRLLLIPAKDGIVFYVESGAVVPGFLRAMASDSFKNRAIALFDWFRNRFKEPTAP